MLFQCLEGEKMQQGGRAWATFFPEEGGFRGAWVKSRQSNCISVHEKSVLKMSLPAHSLSPTQHLMQAFMNKVLEL